MKNKSLTSIVYWVIIAASVLVNPQTLNAQKLGKQYDWLKMIPSEIPVSAGNAYYSMTIKVADLDKEALKNNAIFFFRNAFSSELFKNDKNNFIGFGTYTLNIGGGSDADDIFTVNYILEINVKSGKYEMVLRNFEIDHFDAKVDITKRIETSKNIPSSKVLCDVFHKRNMMVLKSVYDLMDKGAVNAIPTASK